jgi:hypothetical protein
MSFIGGEDDVIAYGIDLQENGTVNGYRIRGAPPVAIYEDELASKKYVDDAAVTSGVSQIIAGTGISVNQNTGAVTISATDTGTYLPLSGGTMTGPINMGSGSISNGSNASFNSVSTDSIGDKSGGNVGLTTSVDMNGFNVLDAALVTVGSVKNSNPANDGVIRWNGSTVIVGSNDQTKNVLEVDTVNNVVAADNLLTATSIQTTEIMGPQGIASPFNVRGTMVNYFPLNMNSNPINNVSICQQDFDAANKTYVDSSISSAVSGVTGGFVPKSGGAAGAMTGQLYANQGIQMSNSSIAGGLNAAFNSINTDVFNTKSGGPIQVNNNLSFATAGGSNASIQDVNSVTCSQINIGLSGSSVILAQGGFNMQQQPILNLPDGSSSAPTNAINYQTAAALVAPKADLTYVDSAVAPKADTTYVDNNRVRTNTKYANDVAASAEIQDRLDEITSQGWTIQIAPGSYAGNPSGTALVINNKIQVGLNAVQVGGVTATEIGGTGNPRPVNVTGTSESIRFQSLNFKGLVTLNSSGSRHNFDRCAFNAGLTIGPTLPSTGYLRFYWCEFTGAITIPLALAIPVYFINCSFSGASFANPCTPAVVFGNCDSIPVANTAGSTAAGGNSYSDLTVKFENNQGGDTYLKVAGTNKRIRLTQVPTVDAGTTPVADRDLTTKEYVDAEVDTKVAAVNAGTGISVDGAANSPTINNDGVLELTAGSNITITGSKSNYTISSSGGGGGGGTVDSIVAGNGITVDSTDPANPIVTNSGILALGVGVGLTSTGGQSPNLQNTGVIELTAGSNVTITGSKTNYTISSSIGGGVQSVTGGIGIAVTGTQLNPTVSATGVTRVTAGTGISVQNVISPTENLQQVTNTGVTSLIAGSNITLSGSTGAVTISASGGGGGGGHVQSVTAGEAITVSGTTSDPIISQSRFQYVTPTLAVGSVLPKKNFWGYTFIAANPTTGTLIMTGLAAATSATLTQRPLMRSTDGGLTWDVPTVNGSQTWIMPGVTPDNVYTMNRPFFLNGRWLCAVGGTLLTGFRVMTSDDDGLTWTPRATPGSTDDSIPVDMAGDGTSTLLSVNAASNNKWFSEDNGDTWTRDLNSASGTGTANYISCAYGQSAGIPVWVMTTTSATSANRIQFSLASNKTAWSTAFGTGTAPWAGTPIFQKVLWVPVRNKFYFFSTSDLQGVGGSGSAGSTTTTNVGCRIYTTSNLAADGTQLPFDYPENFIFIGGHTPAFAATNALGDVFSVSNAGATTGYKVLYQKASNPNTLVPCEVLTSTETGLATATNHDFCWNGTRWIGLHSRFQARTGGAFIIQSPLALP